MEKQKMVDLLQAFLKENDIDWDKTVIVKRKKQNQKFPCTDRGLRYGKYLEFPLTICGRDNTCNIVISSRKLEVYGWILTRYHDTKGEFTGVETEHKGLIRDLSENWKQFLAKQKSTEAER